MSPSLLLRKALRLDLVLSEVVDMDEAFEAFWSSGSFFTATSRTDFFGPWFGLFPVGSVL